MDKTLKPIQRSKAPINDEPKEKKKPQTGIDFKNFSPELVKALTTGSKIDRDRAAFRWLASLPDPD
jgi:hypothetical protein